MDNKKILKFKTNYSLYFGKHTNSLLQMQAHNAAFVELELEKRNASQGQIKK